MRHRRSSLIALLAATAAIVVGACTAERTGGPLPTSTVDLTGEWDFALALPGDEGESCSILGNLRVSQQDTVVTGTSTVFYRSCSALSSGDIVGGSLSGLELMFRSNSCAYAGTLAGTAGDSLTGRVTCSWGNGPWTAVRVGPPSRIALTPQDQALVAGAVQAYAATVQDSAGRVLYGRSIAWSSSETAVARVDSSGLVTAVGPGSTSVTAALAGTSEGPTVSSSVTITVSAASHALDLTGEWDFALALPGDEGGTCSILGTLQLAQADTAVTGTSTVHYRFCSAQSSGAVVGGSLSGSRLTFQSSLCSYTANVVGAARDSLAGSVTCAWSSGPWTAARVGPPSRIALWPEGRALVAGAVQVYTATLQDSAGRVLYGRSSSWSSSDTAVAVVDSTGRVTAVGPGGASVTASFAGTGGSAPLLSSVTVTVSAASYAALSGGSYHTCALTAAGAAYCWGAGGPLGDGSELQSTTPVPVAGGLSFASLSGGYAHTCGVTADGTTYCWGSNGGGRLGTGDSASSATPRPVTGGLPFTRISAGAYHTCGLTAAGAAYCWGSNGLGQLGNGSHANAAAPTPVSGGRAFSSISAGWYHTCALTAAGEAYCWGANAGRLGNGDTSAVATPVAVSGALAFATVTAGGYHTCGVTAGGAAYCWGGGVYGQLGTGSRSPRLVPTPVSGGGSFVALSANLHHTVALTADGRVWGWGSNGTGESGDTTRTEWDVPAALVGALAFRSVTAGWVHTCGISTAGTTYCWGYNSNGQLGDGTQTDRRSPVRVVGQP